MMENGLKYSKKTFKLQIKLLREIKYQSQKASIEILLMYCLKMYQIIFRVRF